MTRRLLHNIFGYIGNHRPLVMVLSAVVVFVTTYSLILPAITLDEQTAAEQGGIDVPAVVQEQEATDTGESNDEVSESNEADSDKSGKEDVVKDDEVHSSSKAGEAYANSLSYEEADFSVALDCNDNAKLPGNTELAVEEITKKDKQIYKDYRDRAIETVEKERASDNLEVKIARLYDISLLSDGNAVEPSGSVDVEINYKKAPKVGEDGQTYVVHITEDENTHEISSELVDDKDVEATVKKGKLDKVSFTADSFSTYAVLYTVDFEYSVDGETFQYSIPGGDTIALSELVDILGIYKSAKNGDESVFENAESFIDEVQKVKFSDETLVKVSKNEENNDWTLTSLKAFDTEESLTITMKNGDVVTVKVTDAQGSGSDADGESLDLNNLYDHALSYGIVAEEIYFENQVHSNFATKTLKYQNTTLVGYAHLKTGSEWIPNIIGNALNPNGGTNHGEFQPEVGSESIYYIAPRDNNRNVVQNGNANGKLVERNADELNDKVELLKTRTLNQAASFATVTPQLQVDEPGGGQTIMVDTSSYGDNDTIYIDLSKTQNAHHPITITKKENQTLVFIMDGNGTVKPPHSTEVKIVDNNGTVIQTKKADSKNNLTKEDQDLWKHIIWDFPNATKIEPQNSIAGVMLVHNSTSNIEINNGIGWIVSAGKVTIGNDWYGFGGSEEPFLPVEVTKVFHGVTDISKINQQFAINVKTIINEQAPDTSAKLINKLVLRDKNNVDPSGAEIGYDSIVSDPSKESVTVKWTTTAFAVGNLHSISEENAKADGNDPKKVHIATWNLDIVDHYPVWNSRIVDQKINSEHPVSSVRGIFGISDKDTSKNTELIENYYKDDFQGNLIVEKRVSGYQGNDANSRTYQIAIKNADGKYVSQDGTLSDVPTWVSFHANDHQQWNHLDPGDYIVEEANAEIEDYSWDWNVTGTEGTEASGKTVKVKANTEGETNHATVTNEYTEKVKVTAKKVWKPKIPENGKVTFELHRYAKITKGTIHLKLTDQNDDPVPSAEFQLYKDGKAIEESVYTTDGNGEILITGLEKGSYHLKQTSAPEGYSMADVTQTGTLTVRDVTTVQELDAHLTNTKLKTTGSVTITLTSAVDSSAISGAGFSLYKEGSLVDRGTTNSAGQLTFENLMTGSYTVKQTSTNADLKVAVDQSFTITGTEDRTLSFTNIAKPVLYTLTFKSSSNNLSAEYRFEKGTEVTFTFDNKNPDYNPYYGISLSGDVSGKVSKGNVSFSITMNGNKVVTLSETGYSNWSNTAGAIQLSPDPHTQDTANSISPARSTKSLRMSAPLKAAGNSVTHTDATPAAAPNGYAEDSEFTAISYTLTGGDWSYTFPSQERTDSDGNPYYYYIVEKEHEPSDYETVSYSGEALNESGTITVTNQKEETAVSFEFSKIWRDAVGDSQLIWPDGKSITVDILQAKGETDNNPSVYATYTIKKQDVDTVSNEIPATTSSQSKLKVTSNSDSKYTFSIEDLPSTGEENGNTVNYIYYVSEKSTVSDYQNPKYYVGTTQQMGASCVGNEGIIANDMSGYALPSTGGSGTHMMTLAGILLVIGSGAVLMIRRRRRAN